MSLYYYIASDTDLTMLDEHLTLWVDDEDDYFLSIKKMFNRKYVYLFDPNCSYFQISFLNGFETEQMRSAFIMRNDLVLADQQKLFEQLKQILPKGGEALFYTLYGSNPSFVPINEIKIDIQNFVVPFPFEFSEHVLYKLQN